MARYTCECAFEAGDRHQGSWKLYDHKLGEGKNLVATVYDSSLADLMVSLLNKTEVK